MTKIYIIISYIVVLFLFFIGSRHIDSLNRKIAEQEQELERLELSKKMLADAYDQEIADLTRTAKERKVVVKEIVKTVAGTKDEECLNRTIPSVIVDKLRKENRFTK